MGMIFHDTPIAGCFLIESQPYADERGVFMRHFDSYEMVLRGCNGLVRQANLSINPKAGTFRGFHGQSAPHGEAKTLTCVTGRFYDYVIDLRKDSKTYQNVYSAIMVPGFSIHVPSGTANAFLTAEDNTCIQYQCSQHYRPESEYGLRWNDPMVQKLCIAEPRIISGKDSAWPDWKP